MFNSQMIEIIIFVHIILSNLVNKKCELVFIHLYFTTYRLRRQKIIS